MIECLCKYGRINEYQKLFREAWEVPEGEHFGPSERDIEIMDNFVTGKTPELNKTIKLLQERLFIMSPKTEKILRNRLIQLAIAYAGVSDEEREEIQKKKRRKRQCR